VKVGVDVIVAGIVAVVGGGDDFLEVKCGIGQLWERCRVEGGHLLAEAGDDIDVFRERSLVSPGSLETS